MVAEMRYHQKMKVLHYITTGEADCAKTFGLDQKEVNEFFIYVRETIKSSLANEEPLSLTEVKDRIEEIKTHLDDPERAESLRSDLYITVLQAIAEEDCVIRKELAELANEAGKIVVRWS